MINFMFYVFYHSTKKMGKKVPFFDIFMLWGLNSILFNIKIITPTFLIFLFACHALVHLFLAFQNYLLSAIAPIYSLCFLSQIEYLFIWVYKLNPFTFIGITNNVWSQPWQNFIITCILLYLLLLFFYDMHCLFFKQLLVLENICIFVLVITMVLMCL